MKRGDQICNVSDHKKGVWPLCLHLTCHSLTGKVGEKTQCLMILSHGRATELRGNENKKRVTMIPA